MIKTFMKFHDEYISKIQEYHRLIILMFFVCQLPADTLIIGNGFIRKAIVNASFFRLTACKIWNVLPNGFHRRLYQQLVVFYITQSLVSTYKCPLITAIN